MKKNALYVFLLAGLLIACSQTQERLITENSVDLAYIGMDLGDLKKAYAGCEFGDTPVYYFGLDGEEKDLVIYRDRQPLLFVWTRDNKVLGLYSLSPEFTTREGFHAGMSLKEIKRLYPGCKMAQDVMSGNMESIYLKGNKITLNFMTNGNTIGIYADDGSPQPLTASFKTDTHTVDFISIQ